jgi:3-oxoacyl-[acyl-carrier protein] reductase
MARELDGKKVIVTGGGRGIGAAIVEALIDQGAHVVFSYRSDEASAHALVNKLRARGGLVVARKADMTRLDDVKGLFDAVESFGGKVQRVINCAGSATFAPVEALSDEAFDEMFALNARGAFFVLREAAKRIEDGGSIVQISTGGTSMPQAAAGGYLASKAAGELLALSLSKELGARQVTVNVVAPGVTRTQGLVLPKPAIEQLVAQTPLGRLGEPKDIAAVVMFLVGEGGRWMTGQVLRPTGGLI